MLMPSALSCDTSQPPLTRLQAAMFASPPASPPSLSHQGAFGNIFDTCRSLQALLTTPQHHQNHYPTQQPSPPSHHQLPSPPLAHAPPPLKLRLRPRARPSADGINNENLPRRRIAKRAPPRGLNKRRRASDDDMGRDDDAFMTDSDVDSDLDVTSRQQQQEQQQLPPSTPKRARIAPEALPLGLERSDFHTLHLLNGGASSQEHSDNYTTEEQGSNVEIEADGEPWSAEDDRILVELVLEKLKLSKSEWQDCARSLGKDKNCLSRRWKSLMLQGEVGLKNRRSSRRTKIHGTWR